MADDVVPRPSADESWQAYRFLADNAIDIVLEADLTTLITWISPSVEGVLGWSPDELVGRQAPDLVHPDDMPAIGALVEALNRQGARVRTSRVRMQCRDGSWKPLQLRGRPALDADGTVVGHVITMQDTSERDDALRALSVLSEGNRALARVDSEEALLQEMCDVIIKTGQYPLAWYGARVDDEAHSVARRAVAGPSMAYATGLTVTWGDDPLGRGPTGTALRTGRAQVRHDFDTDPAFAPWRAAAEAAGLRSSISLPVIVDGRIDGALMVYATEADAFDERAQQLLTTLASDLGLGLHRLRSLAALEDVNQRLAESEARYRLLAEHSSDVIWQAASGGAITWVSESVRSVLGWEPEQLVGRNLDIVHPDDVRETSQSLEALDRGQAAQGRCRVARGDGSWCWMSFTAHRVAPQGTEVDIVSLRDIDDEVRARNALVHAIGHDTLTGMAARPVMLQRIEEALGRLRPRRLAAVLCVGVDRLSAINDAYTHAAGDLVLTTLAARIAEAAGSPDFVGRGAGVEFLVILPGIVSAEESVALAERILDRAKGPVPIGGQRVEPTVSIGIAVGDRRSDAEQLVRDASVAMGLAKADGRDRFAFADASLAEQARRRLEVEARLRDGLIEDRFIPYFQPVVDLATGQLDGYEALVRFQRPDGSIAPPSRFMSVAELSPLVANIDITMLRKGLAALTVIPEPLSVAVNLSTVTLTRPGYAALLEQVLQESEVRLSRVHLEVTETALLGDIAQVVDVMQSVASLGARWYVDDFGTGYSSISHLRDLPVSGLKLDVSFCAGIRAGDHKSIRLAQALAGLAGGLGLDTVAEGIEGPDEAQTLLLQGWRHGQGYRFGRPAPLP